LDLIDDVGDDFGEVQVNKSSGWQLDIIIRVGVYELNLVVVQQFGWLVLATNINHNITWLPIFHTSTSHYYCIFILLDIVFQHRTSKHFIAMESAIVGTDSHILR
jgi:hypothetical protein